MSNPSTLVKIALLPLVICFPLGNQNNLKNETQHRPGRYVPELHGASAGKWVPDYKGLYQHIKVPYDGGYGDSGVKYEHDERNDVVREVVRAFQQKNPKIPFKLGPQDHLRFMIDFNYNGTGWQIIKFEWLRDGENEPHYNFVNENKLWESQDKKHENHGGAYAGYDYRSQVPDFAEVSGDAALSDETVKPTAGAAKEVNTESVVYAAEDEVSNVHVEGEYKSNDYNVTYTEQNYQPTTSNVIIFK